MQGIFLGHADPSRLYYLLSVLHLFIRESGKEQMSECKSEYEAYVSKRWWRCCLNMHKNENLRYFWIWLAFDTDKALLPCQFHTFTTSLCHWSSKFPLLVLLVTHFFDFTEELRERESLLLTCAKWLHRSAKAQRRARIRPWSGLIYYCIHVNDRGFQGCDGNLCETQSSWR